MKVILEIESNQDLEKVIQLLREYQVTIKPSPVLRRQKLHTLLAQNRISIPADFRVNREDAYE